MNRLAILAAVLLCLIMIAPAPVAGQADPQAITGADADRPTPAGTGEPEATTAEPRPGLERPTQWGEPTQVEIAIYVLDVDQVNSADQSFAASVFLSARWNIPTMQHDGPGPLHLPWTEVWTPRLTIINQQQAWEAYPESVEVQPSGEVIYRQRVWGWFSQPMDLRRFPADRQTLSLQVAAAGLSDAEVRMVPLLRPDGTSSGIANQFSLPDFDVVGWRAEPRPYIAFEGLRGNAAFVMEIDIVRRMTYYIVKVIVPLCLIVVMSWVPRWIDPKEVGAALGLSTTSVLTLIAYMFAINVLLPPVSYITYMDRFVLIATLIVFAGLVHTVISTVLVARQNPGLAVRINRWSRAIYVLLLLLALIVSFEIQI